MYSVISCAVAALLVALCMLYRKRRRISISDLPGPEPESFILGNLRQYLQGQAGEIDFQWQETYGDVVRFKGPFGEDRLLVADPKALQYIYRTSGYNCPKQPERREISLKLSGKGLLWAEGPDHRRQRRIMSPAFSSREARALVPLFLHNAGKLGEKWREILVSKPDQTSVFDLCRWLSRATLDAIGEAAFDYNFQALDNRETELGKVYTNLCMQAFGSPTSWDIFRQSAVSRIPKPILRLWEKRRPDPRTERLRHTSEVATKVAKTMIDSKAEDLIAGRPNKDVMSLLVHANVSEDERRRMSDEEMIAQMRTLMLAGHESTSTCLTWILLEVARHADVQNRLRREIVAKRADIVARGGSGFTAADFDGMPYLTAVIKESLRFHPPAYSTYREAARDDVLPLAKPIVTRSGKSITEIPIPKGMKMVTSINGYNRHKDIFGSDSHVYDPDRWLTPGRIEDVPTVGVYGNLLSFAGGVRSCIGWRFAVAEMQSFLVSLVGNFEFSFTPEAHKVRREACMMMAPTIEGQIEKGNQLPLSVKLVSEDP